MRQSEIYCLFRISSQAFSLYSIGMLLDIGFFLSQPFTIILMAFGVMALKASVAGLATLILRLPIRTAVIAAYHWHRSGNSLLSWRKQALNMESHPNIIISSFYLFLAHDGLDSDSNLVGSYSWKKNLRPFILDRFPYLFPR